MNQNKKLVLSFSYASPEAPYLGAAVSHPHARSARLGREPTTIGPDGTCRGPGPQSVRAALVALREKEEEEGKGKKRWVEGGGEETYVMSRHQGPLLVARCGFSYWRVCMSHG